jgi:creatinine amidohydrolase
MERAKIDLSRMSWAEVEEARDRESVVLIPIGTMENQGPQCPLGADYIVARYFATKVAEATNSVTVPGIPYGYSEGFRGFCGTIWLRPSTLHSVVKDVCTSLLEHGFHHLLIVNNHGPNEPPIEHALREVRRTHRALIPLIWPSQLYRHWVPEVYGRTEGVIGHGAEPVTSVMLFLAPDDVRLDLAVADTPRDFQGLRTQASNRATFCEVPVGLYLEVDEISTTGVRGNPLEADAAKGRALLQKAIEDGVSFVNHFREVDTRI